MRDLRDNLYRCTTSKYWVCTIEGRFLTSAKGNRCGWENKVGAANAFKNCDYWVYIKNGIKNQNPYASSKQLDELYKIKYNELLENGTVKFIEMCAAPNWVNV